MKKKNENKHTHTHLSSQTPQIQTKATGNIFQTIDCHVASNLFSLFRPISTSDDHKFMFSLPQWPFSTLRLSTSPQINLFVIKVWPSKNWFSFTSMLISDINTCGLFGRCCFFLIAQCQLGIKMNFQLWLYKYFSTCRKVDEIHSLRVHFNTHNTSFVIKWPQNPGQTYSKRRHKSVARHSSL